jgi:hypothetical protein
MPARRLPCFLAVAFISTRALAQGGPTPPSGPPSLPEVEMDEPPPPVVPLARDTRGGHFELGAGAALRVPFGHLRQGEAGSSLGTGFGAALDLGYGISRSVMVGAWAQVFEPGTHDRGFSVGPFVRYHLVQGMRFDPWLLLGIGYRSQNHDAPGVTRHFSGIDFAHFALGGDYYAWSGLGFGPWLELDAGVLTKRPSTNAAGAPDGTAHVGTDVNYSFVAGLRIVLDLPGK